jgi:DNA-binding XRE family transcriptional regulator
MNTFELTLEKPVDIEQLKALLSEFGIVNVTKVQDTFVPYSDADFFPDKTAEELRGMNLATARKKAKLTQTKLAEMVGIQKSIISAMELGKQPISKQVAQQFATIFDVDYRVFL